MQKNGYWERRPDSEYKWYHGTAGELTFKSWDRGFFNDRNYELFSLLADVRQASYVEPICDPRGMPEDLSEEVAEIVSDWGSNGHSHTYFTIDELMTFDWFQTVDVFFYIQDDLPEDNSNVPWWDDYNWGGPKHHRVSVAMSELSYPDYQKPPNWITRHASLASDPELIEKGYTEIPGKMSYLDVLHSPNWERLLLKLPNILTEDDVEDVRIVMFFDN